MGGLNPTLGIFETWGRVGLATLDQQQSGFSSAQAVHPLWASAISTRRCPAAGTQPAIVLSQELGPGSSGLSPSA